MTKFEKYKLLFEFIHPNEQLKTWINEKTFNDNFIDSWDCLMPIVDKCTQIGFRDTTYDNDVYKKWEEVFDDMGMFLGNHIREVYEACIIFIQWFNEYNLIKEKL